MNDIHSLGAIAQGSKVLGTQKRSYFEQIDVFQAICLMLTN